MTASAHHAGNDIDAGTDIEIASCLNLQTPKSFFLFAGAGSGKTRSLVNALQYIQEKYGKNLRLYGQRVGVITYTNKACDEIKHRIGYDPLMEVSTIHSFVWMLIQGFNEDIKAWLRIELQNEIAELHEKQAKGRAGKASLDRERSIESKTKRLAALAGVKKFQYNPNGDNKGRDSLNHSEVIKIASAFLVRKSIMQQLLIKKFPVLLIDESQDTNKMLMEAFLAVQAAHANSFSLGLFGDTMQRIYADGKTDLGQNFPPGWATPAKKMNHRCPKRIVTLINKLRADVDTQTQLPRTDAAEGVVRLFIIDSNADNKQAIEQLAARKMVDVTDDSEWANPNEVKTLILEHHMAAHRMGFSAMYEPLYRDDALRIGLLDGTLSGLRLFSERVLPVIEATERADNFAVAALIRNHSPLLTKAALRAAAGEQTKQLNSARSAVNELQMLFSEGKEPRFIDILRVIKQTGLFEIPESLRPIAARTDEEQAAAETEIAAQNASEEEETALDCWDEFLLTPFNQVREYVKYVSGNASFDTHQGVKGLQFPRVMVIIDDSSARGFLFSYDKLFGVKGKTKTDLDNEKVGKETGIDRTRRLFYVTCSRAQSSLAIVAYSENPKALKEYALAQNWFQDHEIKIL
jgi:DNA helicase-2/ATP-dependent DNA helicase PcrA